MSPQTKREMIGVNDKGQRVGEYRYGATLSDHEVDLIHQLYREPFEGQRYWTQERLAEKFEVSRSYVSNILRYRKRVSAPTHWVAAPRQ